MTCPRFILVCTNLVLLNAFITASIAATATWKSAVSGDWNDGTKWNSGSPPADGDDAVIDVPGSYTVTFNVPGNVKTLKVGAVSGSQILSINAPLNLAGEGTISTNAECQLAGGTLDGVGHLTVEKKFLWTAGTLAGEGRLTISAGATGEIADGGGKTWSSRTVVNAGTLKWTAGPQVTIQFGARLENNGTVDLQGYTYVINGGGAMPVFINNGTLVRSAGTQEGFWDFQTLNGGTIAVNTGILHFRSGGSASANWSVGAGARLGFSGGTFTNHASSTFSGAGTFVVDGGEYLAAVDQTINPVFEIRGGTVNGPANLTVPNWVFGFGALAGEGRLTIPAGATAEIADAGGKTWSTRTVVNAGTLKWTSGPQVTVQFGARLENTGTVDLQGYTYVINGGGAMPVFINNGTLVRSAGTQEGFWDFSVKNSGTIRLNTGKLAFRSGFEQTAGSFELKEATPMVRPVFSSTVANSKEPAQSELRSASMRMAFPGIRWAGST